MDSIIASTGLPPVRADFVPREHYICPGFAQHEKNRLWPKVWQVTCRLEEIPRIGDYVTYDILDDSLIIIRTGADEIRAYFNVCLHRGRRLTSGCGNTQRLYCNFHGWRWNLDGSLAQILDRSDWDGCPSIQDADMRLREAKVGVWGGFVFINMDPEAEPLEKFLDPMPAYCNGFEFEKMRFRWYKSVRLPCNWKVALEAFNEGYHVAATHPQLLANIGDDRTRSRTYGRHGMFGYYVGERPLGAPSPRTGKPVPDDLRPGMIAYLDNFDRTLKAVTTWRDAAATRRLMTEADANDDPLTLIRKMMQFQKEAALAEGAGWAPMSEQQLYEAGTDWHVFPNLIFLPWPDGALFYRARPDGDDPNRCIYDVWSLARYAPGAEPALQRDFLYGEDDWKNIRSVSLILQQDFDNMAEVQRGMKGRAFPGSRTNPLQESVISNFHRELREWLGV